MFTTQHDYIDAVRAANPIAEVAREFFGPPGGAGPSWLCPWHPDTRPSLSFNPAKGFFRCFGCNLHGDVFTLVELKEGLSFPDALNWLATRAGIPPFKANPAERAALDAEREASLITERVAGYYAEKLRHPWGSTTVIAAQEYLMGKRGIPAEYFERYQLGWADGSACAWVEETHGATWLPVLERAGLAQALRNQWQPDAPSHRDRFFDRVMFPCLRRGLPVFLSGRTLQDGVEPKYLHQLGREAPLYPEDDEVPADRVFVCEGPLDSLSLRAWAYPAYALQGGMRASAIRKLAHVRLAFACFDGDRAGADAALRLAAGLGVSRVRIVELPSGRDPNDLYRLGAQSLFAELVDTPVDPLQFALRDVPTVTLDSLNHLEPAFRLLASASALYAETALATILKPRSRWTRAQVVTRPPSINQ